MARVTFRRYTYDTKSMASFLLSDQVKDVARRAGEDVRDAARGLAAPHSRSGNLVRGYESRTEVVSELQGPAGPLPLTYGPRWGAVVYNEDRAAAPNEFGNGRTPARRILRGAAEPFHTPRGMRRRG